MTHIMLIFSTLTLSSLLVMLNMLTHVKRLIHKLIFLDNKGLFNQIHDKMLK